MKEEKERKNRMFNNEREWKANMMSQKKVDIVFMYSILIAENDRLREEVKDYEKRIELYEFIDHPPVQDGEETSKISKEPRK